MSASEGEYCEGFGARMGITPPVRSFKKIVVESTIRRADGIVNTKDSGAVIVLGCDACSANDGVVFMTRRLAFAFIAACVVALDAAPQQPTFRGTSDAVRVFVTVTDRDGRLITSLKQELQAVGA